MKMAAAQRGVVLAVTLFILVLLTIIGVSAVMVSTTHFRLVGNLQTANEAEMAMRSAIEHFVCEKNGSECKDITYFCKTMYVCVNGHPLKVEVRSWCNGWARSNPEGSYKDQFFDTQWDLEGTIADSILGPNTKVHWGVLVPKGGVCPSRPDPLPLCEPPATATCN